MTKFDPRTATTTTVLAHLKRTDRRLYDVLVSFRHAIDARDRALRARRARPGRGRRRAETPPQMELPQ